MAEYLSPGVYMEEVSLRSQPIEGVSTSTAGFIGFAERGRTIPQLVTSFEQYQRMYGGFTDNSFLAYAVEGFFRNGGKRCYVARIPNTTEEISNTFEGITFTARGKGSWGKRLGVVFSTPNTEIKAYENQFNLTIAYWPPSVDSKIRENKSVDDKLRIAREKGRVEVYNNVSVEPESDNYFLKVVNKTSELVELKLENEGSALEPPTSKDFHLIKSEPSEKDDEINEEIFKLILGTKDAPPKERTGLQAFKEIEGISIVAIPDIHKIPKLTQEIVTNLITHCEIDMKYRFAIIDCPTGQHDINGLADSIKNRSKYAAFYYPWISVRDPLTNLPKLIPPSGHVAGIYARSDNERGVHKAPANEVVWGAEELEFTITKGEQDVLNPLGINVIRSFPGRGIRVWGARTSTLDDPLWKYINVRRLFIYLQQSIERGSQWAVFEPNDDKLWARIRGSISEFLTRVWRDGGLMGTRAEEAFFVKCDRTTMTQDDIDNGRLIAVIGVAPVKPAEFVIFRIGQVANALDSIEADNQGGM